MNPTSPSPQETPLPAQAEIVNIPAALQTDLSEIDTVQEAIDHKTALATEMRRQVAHLHDSGQVTPAANPYEK